MANKSGKQSQNRSITQKSTSENLIHPQIEDVTEIIQFLKNFHLMAHPKAQSPTKLISIKMPQALLDAFRFKAESQGIAYQTMIKKLMHEWLMSAK